MTQPKPRKTLLRFFTAIGILAALYFAGAIHFYLSKPNITRDYYAEHNAANAALSDAEKAWPVYHDAQALWHTLAGPIYAQVGQLYNEFEDRQHKLEADDPHYDRVPSPFINPDNQFDIPADHPLHADALAALEAFQPTLDEIRQAAARPAMGIPITDRWRNDREWTPGEALDPSPDLSRRPLLLEVSMRKHMPIGYLLGVFRFDSTAAISNEDPDRLIDNTRAMIHIARQMHTEQTLLDQLIVGRFLTTAAEIVDKALTSTDPLFSQDQLQTLQTLLWSDAVDQSRLDLTHERRVADELIERTYSGRPGTKGSITIDGINLLGASEGDAPTPRVLLAAMWPTRHLFANRPQVERSLTEGFEAAERVHNDGPASYPQFLGMLAEIEDRHINRGPVTIPLLIAPLGRAALTAHHTRTHLRATATRLALERHKLTNGHYPETLADLVPTYLQELPQDPFNPGHPLNYLLRDNQPILYSVGSNGIDNHATPAPPNTNPADLHARFANPNGPSPTAPTADWILSPAQN
ncbi:MAG: type II secretion system protein GspG [Phycisphaerales bacterium]|nr:hypothetical protein [Planctomycetota bacterium]MCH8507363.1 type II secretion system protein GspG [Phycisphaerales bacterium]